MAAASWVFYNRAKRHIGTGAINLAGSTFRMMLCSSASNAALATISVKGDLTGEVTEANGYSSSGKALAGVSWTAGASASEMRWNSSPVVWTATGGDINSVKFAVVYIEGASAGARKLLCRSQLSAGQFNITSTNTMTVTPSANGYFELN